jgi:hypothetical protein
MSAAANAVHADLLGRIAAVGDESLRPHANVHDVAGGLDRWVGVGRDGVDLIVDDDEDFERVDLGESSHARGEFTLCLPSLRIQWKKSLLINKLLSHCEMANGLDPI